MRELNKLSIGDRLLMVWYWLASFGFFQHYRRNRHPRISCYKVLWRTIRECESEEMIKYRERIGKIVMEFHSDWDLSWVSIDSKEIYIPRYIAVLCKKKMIKTNKKRKENNTIDAESMITESYIDSKGL